MTTMAAAAAAAATMVNHKCKPKMFLHFSVTDGEIS